MGNNEQMEIKNCVYCKSSAISKYRQTKKSKSAGITVSSNIFRFSLALNSIDEFLIENAPLIIECEYCGRSFMLLATQDHTNFIESVLNSIEIEDLDGFCKELLSFGLDSANELFDGICYITVPLSIGNRLRKWLSSKTKLGYEIHIIFNTKKGEFYLSAYRNNRSGRLVGKHIERIG